MELRILDELFRPIKVVDQYESLIWTERFNEIGDFELHIASYPSVKTEFANGTLLSIDKSSRIMRVESFERKINSDGKRQVTIKGSSIEGVLKDRIVRKAMTGDKNAAGVAVEPWTFSAPPARIMRDLFHQICVVGLLSPHDKIPNVLEFNMVSSMDIPEPVDPISLEIDVAVLYDILKDLGSSWGLGFSLTKSSINNQLYWRVYSGRDRTTSQTVNAPVLFTPELDNLTDVKEFETIQASKNVAYVFGADRAIEVYPEDVAPDTDGFERRVISIKADNISAETTENVDAVLTQIGRAELAKHRAVVAFDGEVRQDSQYIYGRHYELGDLVEIRFEDGSSNRMRVSEQIFVSDANGERSYPTLEMYQFVNSGSWLSWESNQTWVDFDDDSTTWSELP